jgi:hypothetical protein
MAMTKTLTKYIENTVRTVWSQYDNNDIDNFSKTHEAKSLTKNF